MNSTIHGISAARPPDDRPPRTSRSGFFWVGVGPESLPGGGLGARGPMYVRWEAPVTVTHQLPVVLVHGGGGQGLDYLGTPDGRPGWAELLVEQGHIVYVVDRPGHGRSAFHPDALGAMAPRLPEEALMDLFAPATDGSSANPLAPMHTRWPGERGANAAEVRQFLSSAGPMAADSSAAQALDGARLAELLDRIGPAIVVTHSAGAPAGWVAADLRPALIAALVAIEPVGPPFNERYGPGSFAWGPTSTPLTYDPPAASADELDLVSDPPPAPGAPARVLQVDPPRRLVNIAQVPIAVVTAQASPFAFIDPITVEMLRQAGCEVEHIALAELAITGNGHGVMLETNNDEVLDVVIGWALQRTAER